MRCGLSSIGSWSRVGRTTRSRCWAQVSTTSSRGGPTSPRWHPAAGWCRRGRRAYGGRGGCPPVDGRRGGGGRSWRRVPRARPVPVPRGPASWARRWCCGTGPTSRAVRALGSHRWPPVGEVVVPVVLRAGGGLGPRRRCGPRAERDGDGVAASPVRRCGRAGRTYSQLGMLAGRVTIPDVPKHRGHHRVRASTCTQPGVDIRPLRQMNGDAHFSEVFLDDAAVSRRGSHR